MLRPFLMSALMVWLSTRAIRRGVFPHGRDSVKWYDRAINVTGGIVLLLFWAFLVLEPWRRW